MAKLLGWEKARTTWNNLGRSCFSSSREEQILLQPNRQNLVAVKLNGNKISQRHTLPCIQ
jgi:hypothetical protein